jgi:hypothetical protein
MEWTALENQIMQNRCKLLEMCFKDSLKKPCRMLTSFAVLSPRSGTGFAENKMNVKQVPVPSRGSYDVENESHESGTVFLHMIR